MFTKLIWDKNWMQLCEIPLESGVKIPSNKLWTCLGSSVEFREVTLGDLFSVLREDATRWSELFRDRFIIQVLDSSAEENAVRTEPSELDRLCFGWVASSMNGQFEFGLDFFGESDKSDDKFSVSLTPIRDLLPLPLVIQPEVELYAGRTPHIGQPIGNKDPRLFEILESMFCELTFYGNEGDKLDFKRELDRRVKEVEDGTAKTYSLEELKSRLEDRLNSGE